MQSHYPSLVERFVPFVGPSLPIELALLVFGVGLAGYSFYRATTGEPTWRKDMARGVLAVFALLALGAVAVFVLQVPTD